MGPAALHVFNVQPLQAAHELECQCWVLCHDSSRFGTGSTCNGGSGGGQRGTKNFVLEDKGLNVCLLSSGEGCLGALWSEGEFSGESLVLLLFSLV